MARTSISTRNCGTPQRGARLPLTGTYAGFSGDTRRVWTRTGTEARVWDTETGNPVSPPLIHPLPVLAAQLSPDGSLLLTFCDSANREGPGVQALEHAGKLGCGMPPAVSH